ncbi:MAG TPA: hypothetical protein VF248_05445 [Nitrososphaeraceae archaeon]
MLLPVRLLSVIPLNGLLKREKKCCNRLPDKFLQAGNFDQTDDNLTEPNIERYIRFRTFVKIMSNSKREMYVCFSKEEISLLEDYAKNKGALNISQALESLVKEKKY